MFEVNKLEVIIVEAVVHDLGVRTVFAVTVAVRTASEWHSAPPAL